MGLEVSNYILSLDDLNAQALHFQLRCLGKQGRGNKAAFLFDKFCQKHHAVHSKPFEYDFKLGVFGRIPKVHDFQSPKLAKN